MDALSNLESDQIQSQSFPNITHTPKNFIQLKNQSLQPQVLKISLHETLTIRVAHNNSYGLSEIGAISKKYIFAIEQLEEESEPLEEGHQFQFPRKVFSTVGEYRLVCINMPKVEAKIIVQKSNSQSADEMFDNLSEINLNQQDLFLKTPVKLAQVKEQEPEQQNVKEPKQQTVGLSNSKSDLEQYQRILTEEDENYSDTLENKYLKYFKEEFKLWRNFFQEQEQKEKKQSLKSKHTKNLSLSEVKEIDPKHKSECDSDNDSNSENNSSSIGKGVSIASHLYSHQEILDRNNDDDINSGRKEMKKTNSEYGFNVMRSEEQKEPTLDKISVFGKEEEEINLPPSTVHHSRRSNHESSSNANKNTNQKKKSWVSMSRTQTNSPALREYKKQNNFLTWAVEWAKQKEYRQVRVQKKTDQHLIKQFDAYMKNKFKVTEFLYC